MNPKIITFYLPQFHRVPENDKWWWEGFTDWDTAKKAEALFPGHNQPRIPLHDNYYNLLDKAAMKWQAELAKWILHISLLVWGKAAFGKAGRELA